MPTSHLPSATAEGGLPSSSTSDQEVLVRVEGVSKKFCRSLKKSLWYGVRDICSELNPFGANGEADGRSKILDGSPSPISHLPSPTSRTDQNSSALRTDEFWSVRDVSFELRRGECLGLIGRNGAGKTTLLKMLNGLIKPDQGRIEMRGRVGALIALGAGFNPILSGRENIYVNGSVLGLTKREIDEKIEEIIDFADIREFIDTPVQNYSSGMQVRLGFAVATAMNPDVLLLDEVLAVGDAAFRNKCYRRIVSLRKKAAVIFVSHSMEQVARICNNVYVMSKGCTIFNGSVSEGITAYEKLNDDGSAGEDSFLSVAHPVLSFSYSIQPSQIESCMPIVLQIDTRASVTTKDFLVRITFFNASGAFVADGNFAASDSGTVMEAGDNRWEIQMGPITLKRGRYRVSINIMDQHGDFVVWSYKQQEFAIVGGYPGAVADYQLQLQSWHKRRYAVNADSSEVNSTRQIV